MKLTPFERQLLSMHLADCRRRRAMLAEYHPELLQRDRVLLKAIDRRALQYTQLLLVAYRYGHEHYWRVRAAYNL